VSLHTKVLLVYNNQKNGGGGGGNAEKSKNAGVASFSAVLRVARRRIFRSFLLASGMFFNIFKIGAKIIEIYFIFAPKLLNKNIMTVVSSLEFASNHAKYLNMALHEHVYIQNGETMFTVSVATGMKKKHNQPDEDVYRADFEKVYASAITGEELKQRMYSRIDAWEWNEK
jgi:hypothetical protein